jgi:predicted enzyme related to lactoylglutathione lyase
MPTIVHFDIATDDPGRARKFYESLFEWKMTSPPGYEDYYMVETQDAEGKAGLGGGLGKRGDPSQRITMYIGVDSVDAYLEKVKELGGKAVTPKMTVPGFGYLANCMDTEGNAFGLWQPDPSAK